MNSAQKTTMHIIGCVIAAICLIVGCGGENPLEEPAILKENAMLGEMKVPDTVAAAPAMPAEGTPYVKEIGYYSDWRRTKPIADAVLAGDTIYLKIVFSEPMQHVAADDKTARPVIYYKIGKQLTRFKIAAVGARGEDFTAGYCKPQGKTAGNVYVSKYTVRPADVGAFRIAVGKKSVDAEGNEMAAFYTDSAKLELGVPLTVSEVGYYRNYQLTHRLTAGSTVVPGETVYTKVVFSEAMAHIVGEGEGARPVLGFLLNETQTQYRVRASGKLASGECKPKGKDLTTWVCKWTVDAGSGGTFTLKVGEASESQTGVRLGADYLQVPPLQVGVGEITLSNAAVAENEVPGTVIGAFSYGRVASPSYRIADSQSDMLFSVDASGQLLTRISFDYEKGSVYSIVIEETVTGRRESFQVEILDVNEPPTDLSISGSSFTEGAGVGTRIGDLSVADADRGDSHTFRLLEGDTYFEIVGRTLKLLEAPLGSQEIEIEVSDKGGLLYSERFTIELRRSEPASGTSEPSEPSEDPDVAPDSTGDDILDSANDDTPDVEVDPNRDSDGDGVPDNKDKEPNNPFDA
ncbi:MAG: cadherin repeat domain-containing protein [Candidatus Poribacteria bacterium]|nr:cadherin repeat domain-containing protein [Candidatus Poribacteria bacterium]